MRRECFSSPFLRFGKSLPLDVQFAEHVQRVRNSSVHFARQLPFDGYHLLGRFDRFSQLAVNA